MLRTACTMAVAASAAAVHADVNTRMLGFSSAGPGVILRHASSIGMFEPWASGIRCKRLALAPNAPAHGFVSRRTGGGEARSAFRVRTRMSTAPDSAIASDSIAGNTGASASELPRKSWVRIVWEFSRPHTIIGSVLSIVSLHLFAATAPGAAVINISALGVALAWALVCGVLINIYVTGLNQIFDVEIDKINKPYLPIAAGHLSIPAAWAVCLGSLLLGTLPSIIAYPFDKGPLLGVTLGSALLGTAYSAPPLRLKRFPLLAALSIIVVRGTLVNLGFYAHAAGALTGSTALPDRALIASVFFALFGCVIALIKDVPDVGGDRVNHINTLSVRLGAPKVLSWGTKLLSSTLLLAAACCAYGALAGDLLSVPLKAARLSVAGAGVVAAWWVHTSSKHLLPSSSTASTSRATAPGAGAGGFLSASEERDFSKQAFDFYMQLWKLFYGAYLVLPFAL